MANIIKIDVNNPSKDDVNKVAHELINAGVAIIPTDSVYGIACAMQAGNPALDRIFQLKKRDKSQTLPLLIGQEYDLALYGKDFKEWNFQLTQKFWPGALTVVCNASEEIPSDFVADDETIALRFPDSAFLSELLENLSIPIACTSANLHGKPATSKFKELDNTLLEQVDIVVDGGECPVGVASSVVDITGSVPNMLREGSISAKDIAAACIL